MRISDWSADVCSSNLVGKAELQLVREAAGGAVAARPMLDCRGGIMFARLLIFVGIAEAAVGRRREAVEFDAAVGEQAKGAQFDRIADFGAEIGRASWRVRVCEYG